LIAEAGKGKGKVAYERMVERKGKVAYERSHPTTFPWEKGTFHPTTFPSNFFLPIILYMNTLYFFFSTGIWVAATLVVRSKNPVHSVFYLVLLFCNASALLFMLGLEFFALLNIYVYVGALAVMFLFVVMLLDITYTEIVASQRGYYPIAILFIYGLIFALYLYDVKVDTSTELWEHIQKPEFINYAKTLVDNTMFTYFFEWGSLSYQMDNMKALTPALYIHYVDLLLIASLILLVAMIGAVVLCLKKRVDSPLQDIYAQHNREFQKVVYTIKKENN
jgi:NADH-quinone oxidoreductase subunit J